MFKKGDEQAFAALYHKFATGLFNYILRMIGDWHYAEDILLETFTKLAHSDLKETGSLKAWLYRVATNACYKLFRKNKGAVFFSEETFKKYIYDPTPDLIKEMKIQKLLSELPEIQRVVIALKFYEGMSYQEIADVLCCPLGTVKSRMHEGLGRLRRIMVRQGSPARRANMQDSDFCN